MSNAHNAGVPDRKRALAQALDDAARTAEEALAEGKPLGIRIVALDEHLEPVDVGLIPAHLVPPTPGSRRFLMEGLAPGFLATATGYIAVTEVWRPGHEADSGDPGEAVLLQAETRAGDGRVRTYPIIRSATGLPSFAPPQEKPAPSRGTFSRLLQVAASFQGYVDETSLKLALAAHADVIETLGEGDLLMFAVGEHLVQVIGPHHGVRLCTKLRLRDIKAAAAAGDASAQRSYFELTAGQGVFTHLDPIGRSATVAFTADRARPHTPSVRRPKGH
jgi:hypothetical protein